MSSNGETVKNKLKIFTWNVDTDYLYYLSHANCDFFVPVKEDASFGYAAISKDYPWKDNIHTIEAEKVRDFEFDVILFQSKDQYMNDQYEILSDKQRTLPKIYLEHNPPLAHPSDTRHFIDEPDILLIHVTHYNQLMWDIGQTPSIVIENGVKTPSVVSYSGQLEKGLVIVNNLKDGGRSKGFDIFQRVRRIIPLDLIGEGSEEIGGLGKITHNELPFHVSKYRFVFSPVRYNSLALSVCESMMIGSPIVTFATAEMSTVIINGYSGFRGTDLNWLILKMKELLKNPKKAKEMAQAAKAAAERRFSIERFVQNWEVAFNFSSKRNFAAIPDRLRLGNNLSASPISP